MAGSSRVRLYVCEVDGTIKEVGFRPEDVPLPVTTLTGLTVIATDPLPVQIVDGITANLSGDIGISGQPLEVRDTSNPPVQISGGRLDGICDAVAVSEIQSPVPLALGPNGLTITGTVAVSSVIQLEEPREVQAATLSGVTVTGSILPGASQAVRIIGFSGTSADVTVNNELKVLPTESEEAAADEGILWYNRSSNDLAPTSGTGVRLYLLRMPVASTKRVKIKEIEIFQETGTAIDAVRWTLRKNPTFVSDGTTRTARNADFDNGTSPDLVVSVLPTLSDAGVIVRNALTAGTGDRSIQNFKGGIILNPGNSLLLQARALNSAVQVSFMVRWVEQI